MPLRHFEPAICFHCSLVRMSFATKQTCASSPSPVRRFWTPSKELRSKLVLQIQHWAAPSSWSLISCRMLITDTQTCTPRWVIKATTSVRHDALFLKSHTWNPFFSHSPQSWVAVCQVCWRGTSSTRMRLCLSTLGSALRNRTKA